MTILPTSGNITNNTSTFVLSTPAYPAGIWLFSYQATIYFATAPTSFTSFTSYLSGPTGGTLGVITQFAKMTTGTQTLTGSNAVTSLSSSFSVNLTAATSISLYLIVNTNPQTYI